MFNDVVVTLVQLIESSESSVSVSTNFSLLSWKLQLTNGHQKLHALFVFGKSSLQYSKLCTAYLLQ